MSPPAPTPPPVSFSPTTGFVFAGTTGFVFAGTIRRRRLLTDRRRPRRTSFIGGAPRGVRIDARGFYCSRECCDDTGGASHKSSALACFDQLSSSQVDDPNSSAPPVYYYTNGQNVNPYTGDQCLDPFTDGQNANPYLGLQSSNAASRWHLLPTAGQTADAGANAFIGTQSTNPFTAGSNAGSDLNAAAASGAADAGRLFRQYQFAIGASTTAGSSLPIVGPFVSFSANVGVTSDNLLFLQIEAVPMLGQGVLSGGAGYNFTLAGTDSPMTAGLSTWVTPHVEANVGLGLSGGASVEFMPRATDAGFGLESLSLSGLSWGPGVGLMWAAGPAFGFTLAVPDPLGIEHYATWVDRWGLGMGSWPEASSSTEQYQRRRLGARQRGSRVDTHMVIADEVTLIKPCCPLLNPHRIFHK